MHQYSGGWIITNHYMSLSLSIWGLANQMSHVLTIIMLTFWWLEYRMSKVLTLWVLDYRMSRLSHISFNNCLARMSNVLLISGVSHIPCNNPLGARLSCVSCINPLRTRLSHAFYINLLMVKVSHVSCINTLGARLSWYFYVNLLMARVSLGLCINLLVARVSLVSCINLFGANQLLVDAFSVQFGANQIINWCAPITYLNYLVSAKSFGAHQLIS